MSKPKLTKILSWVPIFSGFYNTCWDPASEAQEIIREEGLDEDFCWWQKWDRAGYQNDCAEIICEQLMVWLPRECGIESMVHEDVVNPKYYNFENDSINMVCQVNLPKFGSWFRKVLRENSDHWKQYLGRYRSRDGFASFYSYDPEEWKMWTNGYRSFAPADGARCLDRRFSRHAFGSCLQFWFELQTDRLSPGHKDMDTTLWECVRSCVDLRTRLNLPAAA